MNSSKRGFTLIELLVVIAIIGILSSVVLASLNSARKKGRDARRISDMKQMQLALELYYDANGSTYPVSAALATISGTVPDAGMYPTYIASAPLDPNNSGSYIYQYQSIAADGTACSATPCPSYLLVAQLENGANASSFTGTVGGSATVCAADSAAPFTYCVKQ